MKNLQLTLSFLSTLILLFVSNSAKAICGLSNDDALCQSFIQASIEANNWPNCTSFCSFEIYAGTYQGQDVIVLQEGCENPNSYDELWEIYNCAGTLLERCTSSSGNSTCTAGGGVLNNVTYVENLYFCGSTLPSCPNGGCEFLECQDQEVVVANDIFGGIHVDDIVVESGGNCNLSFSNQIDLDYIDLSCADVGTFSVTVYSLNNPSVNCQAQITVIDNGCFSLCEEFECLDYTAVVSTAAGANVSVDDLVAVVEPSCNYSFDAEVDIDAFDFDCSNVGIFQLTVYNLDDPQFNCTSTITIEDGGCSGSDCEIFECADVEVFPAFDIVATVEVTQVALEFEGECNLSFDPELDVDFLSYTCAQLGTHTVTVYNLDNPSINCTATVTVSDGGCTVPGDCEIFECADVEVFPAFDIVATVDVTQVALEFEGECNLSFDPELDVDFLSYTCAQLGTHTVTVYNLDNPSINCTATVTVSDGGCTVPGDCEHPDYAALMALYNSAGGPNWDNNTGWAAGAAGDNCEPCTWYGIQCENNRVVCLDLDGNPDDCEPSGSSGNNLIGVIPSQITQLVFCKAISIEDNGVEMTFPFFITDLDQLEVLGLEGGFTGSLPLGLGSMMNLRIIDIDGDLIGTLPSQIGFLSDLEELKFISAGLSGEIPSSFGNLSNLRRLRLDGNELTGPIPVSFGNLTMLEYLNLRGNQLSGILPAELGGLSNLTVLSLNNNNFEGCIPREWEPLCQSLFLGNISGNPLLDSDSWDDFCSTLEGACESVSTEDELARNVRIHPNPTTGLLTIEEGQNIVSSYIIQDISGRVVVQSSVKVSGHLDVSDLENGVYFLRLFGQNGALLRIAKVLKL